MGSMVRMERCEQFVKEFGPDYAARASLQPGALLTVKGVYLGQDEIGDGVRMYYVLDDGQHSYLLCEEEPYFDPEFWDYDHLAAVLSDGLDISEEQARQRLQRAELIGLGDEDNEDDQD